MAQRMHYNSAMSQPLRNPGIAALALALIFGGAAACGHGRGARTEALIGIIAIETALIAVEAEAHRPPDRPSGPLCEDSDPPHVCPGTVGAGPPPPPDN